MGLVKPLVLINGQLSEIPSGDKIDPTYYNAGAGGESWMAYELSGQVDFGSGNTTATAFVSHEPITSSTLITAIVFTDKLEEVLVLNMRLAEVSRVPASGFTVMAFAPEGACGIYQFKAYVSGTL